MARKVLITVAALMLLRASAYAQTPLESANTLAKEGRTAEAIAAVEAMLAERPGDLEARKALAKYLGWSRDYGRAEAEYRRVLDAKPGDAEALSGLARVLSWKGEFEEAERLFRESLAIEPGDAEARTALARTLWWKGDLGGALAEAERAVAERPGDAEAARLRERLREEKGPSARASFARSWDSDDNSLDVTRLSGYYNAGPYARLDLSYSMFEASRHGTDAEAGVFDLKDTLSMEKGLTLTPRLSIVTIDTGADDTIYMAGGLSAAWAFAPGKRLIAAYSYSPLLDTVQLMRNDVRAAVAALAYVNDWRAWTFAAGADYSEYSDGNSRYGLSGSAAWKVLSSPDIVLTGASDYKEFSERTSSGYFNPPHIFTNSVSAAVSGPIAATNVSYRLGAKAGLQSFEGSIETISSAEALIQWRAAEGLVAEAGYKYSRSALESSSGFRFEEVRAGVSYIF